MTELKDKLGRVIKVGDYFITAQVNNSSAILQFGRVLELQPGTGLKRFDGHKLDTRVVCIMCHDLNFNRAFELRNHGGVSKLEFPDRLLIVEGHSLPDNVRELMDGFEWKG